MRSFVACREVTPPPNAGAGKITVFFRIVRIYSAIGARFE
jgi:hypothetical protein